MGNQASGDRTYGENGGEFDGISQQSAGAPRRKRDFLKNLMDDPMKSLGIVYYPDGDSDDEDSDIDKVLEGLYVGGMEGAMDATALKRRGITHILNLSTYDKNPKCHHHGQFEYMILNLPDLPSTNLEQYFPRTNAFISTGRERGGVYVHCMWGMSRGPSTVMAYLIAEQKMDFREALSAVKSVRPQTHPNHGFQRQLEGYVQTMANRNSYGASYGGSNTQPSNYNNNTASNTSPGVPRVLRTKTVPRETASPGSGDEGALAYWNSEVHSHADKAYI
mmetsp:Transcript_14578/g.34573  ORF Transcript_14578/g.34573 Transcript_14578/m.34573 type:complete len:277 (+) Transcript_14578:39-869(+)